ncbi:MAG: hypothetical protein P9L99_20025 [Candidatus Lernaella stagnicola]|nr:hypothetical protein [Candidatus Lernaella stagnicola]
MNDTVKKHRRRDPLTLAGLALTALVVYGAHFFPASAYLLIEQLPWSLVILAALLALRFYTASRAPRAFLVLRIGYYVALVLYLVPAIFLVWMIDPKYTLGFIVVGGTAAVVIYRTRFARAPWLVMIGILGFMALLLGGHLALLGVVGTALVLFVTRFWVESRLPRLALLGFFAVMLLGARVGVFYVMNPTGDIPDILAQDGVEAIFTHADLRQELPDAVGCCLQFVAPDCRGDRVLIGSHRGLFVVDKDREFRRLQWGKAFDNAVVDCKRRKAFVGDFDEHRLVELATDSLTFSREKILDVERVTQLAYDADGGSLYLLNEHDMHIRVVDEATLEPVRTYDKAGQQGLVIDPLGRALITSSIARLRVLDLDTGEPKRFLKLGYSLRMAADVPGRRLFVSSFTSGTIHEFDMDTWRETRRLKLARGIRYLAFDEKHRRLFAGGYLDGRLYVVDIDTWRVVRRVYLGQRIRWLELSRDRDWLYATSNTGAYRIGTMSEDTP